MSLLRSPPPSASGTNDSICLICKEGLFESQDCIFISQCEHAFHRSCMEKTPSNSMECPICKRPCELSDFRPLNLPSQDPRTIHNDSADPSTMPLQTSRSETTSSRGRGRGAFAKQYNTRSSSKNLTPDTNQLQLPDMADILNGQGENNTASRANLGNNQGTHSLPSRNTPRRTGIMNDMVDYARLSHMIESSLTRILQNLNMNPNSNTVHPNTTLPSVPNQYTHPRNDTEAQGHLRNLSPMTNFSLGTDRIASIIKNWNLQFDGSAQGLDVEEFLYRVKLLTADNFDEDYTIVCKHLNVLLTGKAREWFWRYRKQVPSVVWEDFCAAIRYQYKDFKSDSDIREELRNRKQRLGENFESFYDSVSSILDRLSTPIPETELIEIVKRNLRPEIRHELLYVPIFSIAHLRKLIQMRENLLNDEGCRRQLANKAANIQYPRRNVAEIELLNDPVADLESESGFDVDAIVNPSSSHKCWNCQEAGHFWEDCIKERTVFCYGCGARNTYKPSCVKCSTRKLFVPKISNPPHVPKN